MAAGPRTCRSIPRLFASGDESAKYKNIKAVGQRYKRLSNQMKFPEPFNCYFYSLGTFINTLNYDKK